MQRLRRHDLLQERRIALVTALSARRSQTHGQEQLRLPKFVLWHSGQQSCELAAAGIDAEGKQRTNGSAVSHTQAQAHVITARGNGNPWQRRETKAQPLRTDILRMSKKLPWLPKKRSVSANGSNHTEQVSAGHAAQMSLPSRSAGRQLSKNRQNYPQTTRRHKGAHAPGKALPYEAMYWFSGDA